MPYQPPQRYSRTAEGAKVFRSRENRATRETRGGGASLSPQPQQRWRRCTTARTVIFHRGALELALN